MQTAGDGDVSGGDVREYNRINFLSMVSRGIKRGAAPFKNIPSPLNEGRGIKSEGLVNNYKEK